MKYLLGKEFFRWMADGVGRFAGRLRPMRSVLFFWEIAAAVSLPGFGLQPLRLFSVEKGWRCPGGLVGQNILGDIKASYASGAVSANAIKALAGGLVGINQGTITASYARSPVSASGQGSVKSGLAAYDLGTETYSYWDT